MSAHLDGGPAYPAPATPKTDMHGYDVTSGMSLRDWFAGQALAGMTAAPIDTAAAATAAGMRAQDFMVAVAFQIADAMLAARKDQP